MNGADASLERDDAIHDHCGIVGIFDPANQVDVRQYLVIAMSALQHRGQESAGVALLLPDGEIFPRIGMGRVRDVFAAGTDDLPPSWCGIGHVRYSTTGSSVVENAAPFVLKQHRRLFYDDIAIAHNGNVVNSGELRAKITNVPLQSDTDSEVIAALLLASPGANLRARLHHVAPQLKGAYSLVLLSEGKLYGLRDPYGMRPLSLGRLGDGWILASETCALERVGATFVRDVEPGELITIDETGLHSELFSKPKNRQALCVFEFVYFGDATSVIAGRNVYGVREELGRQLAREQPADADFVVPVPLTSIPMALGYAEVSGLPYAEPIITSRYADRTFIKPDQRLRQLEIDLKFNIVQSKIEGKRLVIVEDSLVRGNTLSILNKALRRKGAKEIHIRIGSPPIKHPCYFGIDIPTEEELPASHLSIDEIGRRLGADSLGYLSLAGLARATGAGGNNAEAEDGLHHHFCYGCMKAKGYPFAIKPEAERIPSAVG